MREIKFRAWDSQEKRMVEVNTLHFPETGYPCPVWGSDKDNKFTLLGRYKLCQFTGLHDKNGKEIYEGDLIRNENMEVEEVEWGEGEWIADKLALNSYLFIDGKAEGIEVIGNCFENPELLTKNNDSK